MKLSTICLGLLTSLVAFLPVHADDEALKIEVPFNPEAALSLDFHGPAWKKAGTSDRFQIMGKSLQVMGLDLHEEPTSGTRVYLTRDATALYIGFVCKDEDIRNLVSQKAKADEEWPPGDRMEIYMSGESHTDETYEHLVFNVEGDRGESRERRATSPREGWQVVTRVDEDQWVAVVRIPYELIGITSKSAGMRGLFFRDYHPGGKSSERSTWGGGTLHNPSSFGEWVFMP